MESLAELYEALHSNDYSRANRAAAILSHMEIAEATNILLEALSSPKRRVRQAAILGASKNKAPEFIPKLFHILTGDDHFLRRDAAYALGQMGDAALPALLEALHSQDKAARRYAVQGLRWIKNPIIVPDLVNVLLEERKKGNGWTAYHTVGALNNIGDPAAIPGLLKAIHDSKDNVQRAVIATLGSFKSKEAVPDLLKILSDPQKSDILRVNAASTLQAIQDNSIIPDLLPLLSDKSWQVRQRVLYILASMKENELRPYFIRMLEDEHAQVRGAAISALGRLKNPVDILHLISAIDEKNQPHLASITDILQAIGTPEALLGAEKALLVEIELYSRSTLSGRKNKIHNAILKLGRIGTPSAIQALVKLLDNIHSIRTGLPIHNPNRQGFIELGGFRLPVAYDERYCDIAALALEKTGKPELLDLVSSWREKQV